MEVDRLTAGGDTSLEGEIGRGRLRVPFDNVSGITFEPLAGEREPVVLTVRGATTFYGQTPGGAYQIRARDLRSIELLP